MARITVDDRPTTRGKRVHSGQWYLVRVGTKPQHFAVNVHAIAGIGAGGCRRRVALVSISDKGLGRHKKTRKSRR